MTIDWQERARFWRDIAGRNADMCAQESECRRAAEQLAIVLLEIQREISPNGISSDAQRRLDDRLGAYERSFAGHDLQHGPRYGLVARRSGGSGNSREHTSDGAAESKPV